MLLKSDWNARVLNGHEPAYQRLAGAITEDIVNGEIRTGDRLPAHRDLCYRLGVGLGTVTKAYGLLERQGLVSSVAGSGTFAAANLPAGKVVDLSVNIPPNIISDRLLSATLSSLASAVDSAGFGAYTPYEGSMDHRLALSSWLKQYCASANADRMVLCSGGQHALWIALSTLARPDVVVASDDLTFHGLQSATKLLQVDLVGIASDEEGVMPEAIERKIRELSSIQKTMILYVNPTAQNPTGKTMSMSRIKDIAEIAERHDITVIEDDVYAAFAIPNRQCLVDLAPERVFYINSLAKILTSWFRLGILMVPMDKFSKTASFVRSHGAKVSPVASHVMYRWISDGVASHVASMTHAESRNRNEIAQAIFVDQERAWIGRGFHMFLPMARPRAEKLEASVREKGILVTSPALSVSGDSENSGIRLCLGGPTRVDLFNALATISSMNAAIPL
jgi:DNA-binding transcriptional MocR family regulator